MKKILAISVIFALVAGAAFAQISGTIAGTVNVLQGMTDEDATVEGVMGRVRLSGAGQTDDGKFGGYLRLDRGAGWAQDNHYGFYGAGWAWWQPHEIFRLQIGQDRDNAIAMENIARWGFYQNAADIMSVV